jgi:regulator of replication initiation timing
VVQEIILRRLIGELGPAGRIVWDLLQENQRLRVENEDLKRENWRLEATVEARRTLKRHSPAQWRFRVRRWELGEQVIKPKEYPEGKTVPNLRVYIYHDDPSEGAPYWDITSKRLIGMLLPILPHIAGTNTYVEISKHGDGRTSQYSMSVHPS